MTTTRMTRRGFVQGMAISASAGLAGLLTPGCTVSRAAAEKSGRGYLRGYSEQPGQPRAAATQWFRDAKFGMFVHYNVYSMLPGSKHHATPGDPPLAELMKRFTAEHFDADAIADLAVAAGMKYVNFTPYHGGGPYLFRSAVASPTSVELPCGRDLVAEIARACAKRNLGLFLYIHASISESAEPVRRRNLQIFRELLTQYGPIAGLWFDTDSNYYKHRDRYPHLDETFALIRSLQPQTLISFCHGVTGDEDFITYEHRFHRQSEFKYVPAEVKKKLADKPVEICTTMQLDHPGGKGTKMWFNVEGAYHRGPDDVWALLAQSRHDRTNLLLNIGPRGDGSIHPADAAALREVGTRLKSAGWPAPATGPSTSREGEDR